MGLGSGNRGHVGRGVRLFLTERLFIAPDIRMGFYPILQSTVGIGYRF